MRRAPSAVVEQDGAAETAALSGCDRCVPVTRIQPASAMKTGSMSSSHNAMRRHTAIEYQCGKCWLIANAENNERGQAFGIGDDTACVHARVPARNRKRPICSSPTRADSGGFKAQPCSPGCDIGRRATYIFAEGGHTFQKAANLCAIQVNRRSANRYQVEPLHYNLATLLLQGCRIHAHIKWRFHF